MKRTLNKKKLTHTREQQQIPILTNAEPNDQQKKNIS